MTCDYVNLMQDEVSPGRLIENGTLQFDSGISAGKSASFSQILPGETAEVYFYYAVPEDLPEQPLTAQFTINDQTYSYELPADRAGTLPPALPEPEEPETPEESETPQQPEDEDSATEDSQQTAENADAAQNAENAKQEEGAKEKES